MAPNEAEIILRLVNDFAMRSILPLVERHDIYMQPDQLEFLAQEAEEIGLLNTGPEKGGGLWEDLDGENNQQLSIAILSKLAEYNAGVAWHFHQLAFGRWLAHRLGVSKKMKEGVILASIQGHYGLARMALPRFLLGVLLVEEDRIMLNDYFHFQENDFGIVIHAAENWDWLLIPIFNKDKIDWCYITQEEVNIDSYDHSHGLDEIMCFSLKSKGDISSIISLDVEECRSAYSEALQLNAFALLAISLGAVKHGYRLASDYASIRSQGGKIINQHPVVQELLADILSAIELCNISLNELARPQVSNNHTGAVLAVRSRLQPLLCTAATNAVQVMGGIGYMRDTGVEKILRDVNQLRLMHGTPLELRLFVAEWERLQ